METDKVNKLSLKYGKGSLLTNSENKFIYEFNKIYLKVHKAECYVFEIWEIGREKYDKFSFILKIIKNSNDLKVVDLFPDIQKYYLGKKISINMILEAKKLFKKRIISSTNMNSAPGEKRFKDARKYGKN